MPHTTTAAAEERSQQQRPRAEESYLSSLVRWLQVKKYQYEVTFSLYMLTPTEKFIFNFIVFVLIAMLVVAASMYLPNHASLMYRRLWYYVHGEIAGISKAGGAGVAEVLKSAAAAAAAGDGGAVAVAAGTDVRTTATASAMREL